MVAGKRNYGEESIFSVRLKELMNERKVTQQQLAEYVGTTRQAISQYLEGSVLPNIEKLYKISRFFNVSTDFLLGISDAKSIDATTQWINKKLGLSEKSIHILEKMNLSYGFLGIIEIVNLLIENAELPPNINDYDKYDEECDDFDTDWEAFERAEKKYDDQIVNVLEALSNFFKIGKGKGDSFKILESGEIEKIDPNEKYARVKGWPIGIIIDGDLAQNVMFLEVQNRVKALKDKISLQKEGD